MNERQGTPSRPARTDRSGQRLPPRPASPPRPARVPTPPAGPPAAQDTAATSEACRPEPATVGQAEC